METLAQEISGMLDYISATYYYWKDERVLKKAQLMSAKISEFCGFFLQGNIFGMEEAEYQNFSRYVLQVLEDYMEAIEQKDMVYMLDTLEYGLREVLNIYVGDEKAEESCNE